MFKYQLELEDGTPADPPTFTAAVPNWKAGDNYPARRRQELPGRRPQAAPDAPRHTCRAPASSEGRSAGRESLQ
jgi:hypothetical protein